MAKSSLLNAIFCYYFGLEGRNQKEAFSLQEALPIQNSLATRNPILFINQESSIQSFF
jgi:hypothetical protein